MFISSKLSRNNDAILQIQTEIITIGHEFYSLSNPHLTVGFQSFIFPSMKLIALQVIVARAVVVGDDAAGSCRA
jgi:hypothetical protein